jgi:hypothetical protein
VLLIPYSYRDKMGIIDTAGRMGTNHL